MCTTREGVELGRVERTPATKLQVGGPAHRVCPTREGVESEGVEADALPIIASDPNMLGVMAPPSKIPSVRESASPAVPRLSSGVFLVDLPGCSACAACFVAKKSLFLRHLSSWLSLLLPPGQPDLLLHPTLQMYSTLLDTAVLP